MEEQHVAPPPARSSKDACGCELGGIAASVALIAYVAYLFAVQGSPSGWQLRDLGWGAAVVFGAALAGKAIGIARARRGLEG